MPAKRAAMRQVRDVVRVRAAGISAREIAIRIGVAPSTVRLTMKRLADAGLDEAAIPGMNDETLEARLFSRVGTKQGLRRRVEPDFALIHRELKRRHVTLLYYWMLGLGFAGAYMFALTFLPNVIDLDEPKKRAD